MFHIENAQKYNKHSEQSQKALLATFFVIFGFGLSQIIRLFGNIALSRLLVPEYFGITAISQVILTGITLFSDLGLSQGVIRSNRSNDSKFLNTAWTIQIIRGMLLSLIMLLVAYPVSMFYTEKTLLYLIPVIGINSLIQGFQSTSIILLNKNLKQGKLNFINIVIQIISTSVMLIVAYLTHSIWSLILSGLLTSLLRAIWSHMLKSSIKHKLFLEREAAIELLHFGKWILFSTSIMFLASQIDKIIFGKIFSLRFFGIYNIALLLSELPKQVILKVSHSVFFPLFTTYASISREIMKQKVQHQRRFVLYAIIALVCTFTTFGDYIIHILYDDRYKAAEWILPILGLGIWPLILYSTGSSCLLALGKPKYHAFANLIKFIYMLVAVPILNSQMGYLGAVLAVSLNDIPAYLVIYLGLRKEKISFLKQDLIMTLTLISLILLLLLIRNITGLGFPGYNAYKHTINLIG